MQVIMGSDLSEFIKDADELNRELADILRDTMKKSVGYWVNIAVKYVPPNMGGEIPAHMYRRSAYPLHIALADLENNFGRTRQQRVRREGLIKAHIDRLRKGFRWLVIIRPYYGLWYHWYFKTKKQAERYEKIANRGLARAMLGVGAPAIGEPIPTKVQALMRKSRHIAKSAQNCDWKKAENNNEFEITIPWDTIRILGGRRGPEQIKSTLKSNADRKTHAYARRRINRESKKIMEIHSV